MYIFAFEIIIIQWNFHRLNHITSRIFHYHKRVSISRTTRLSKRTHKTYEQNYIYVRQNCHACNAEELILHSIIVSRKNLVLQRLRNNSWTFPRHVFGTRKPKGFGLVKTTETTDESSDHTQIGHKANSPQVRRTFGKHNERCLVRELEKRPTFFRTFPRQRRRHTNVRIRRRNYQYYFRAGIAQSSRFHICINKCFILRRCFDLCRIRTVRSPCPRTPSPSKSPPFVSRATCRNVSANVWICTLGCVVKVLWECYGIGDGLFSTMTESAVCAAAISGGNFWFHFCSFAF